MEVKTIELQNLEHGGAPPRHWYILAFDSKEEAEQAESALNLLMRMDEELRELPVAKTKARHMSKAELLQQPD